jgi:SAM-dependent methyltransferase
MAGLEPPEVASCCELGFGQGVSLAIHSAATGTAWHGNDFNPAHVLNARTLCRAGGAQATLSDESFRDYAERDDLPTFDYIALHGIWSWISDENRKAIISFLRKNLRVGGVVYVSYNVLAGWARFLPLREFMMDSLPDDGRRGGPEGVKAAVAGLEKLVALKAKFIEGDPRVTDTIAQVTKADPRYVAHEYLNRDWKPMSFADAGRLLVEAKLSYACSANLMDHAESTYLHTEQKKMIDAAPSVAHRENLRDIIINRRFRQDYWVRGVRKLPLQPHTKAVQELEFMLTANTEAAESKIAANIGISKLTEAAYKALIGVMADRKPHRFSALAQALASERLTPSNVSQMLMMLCHRGHAALCQPEAVASAMRSATDQLNAHLLQGARAKADISTLASPVTGGGFGIGRVDQLLLLGHREGARSADELAAFVWRCLSSQNERLVKEGKTIETDADNLEILRKQADIFLGQLLQVLKALAIA